MPEKERNINFRGSEEYREYLQREALNRKVKVQGLIEAALSAYLSASAASPVENSTPPSPDCDNLPQSDFSPEISKWVQKLVRVLKSPQFAPAIQQNLDAFLLGVEAIEQLQGRGHDGGASASNAAEGNSLAAGIAGLRAGLSGIAGRLEGVGQAPKAVRRKAT